MSEELMNPLLSQAFTLVHESNSMLADLSDERIDPGEASVRYRQMSKEAAYAAGFIASIHQGYAGAHAQAMLEVVYQYNRLATSFSRLAENLDDAFTMAEIGQILEGEAW